MKRLLLLALLVATLPVSLLSQSFSGVYQIDEVGTFYATVLDPTTGGVSDTAPTYRIYEETTSTAITNGTMTILDSTNTNGLYQQQITFSAANGYENGKSYCFYWAVTVSSVEQSHCTRFIIRPNWLSPTTAGRTLDVASTGEAGVDFSNVNGTLDAAEIGSDAITAAKIATDAIGADELAADAIGASELAANAIGASEVADGAIDAGAIASDALTAAKIAADVTTEITANVMKPLTTGTAQGAGTGNNQIQLASAEDFTGDDRINCSLVHILSGQGKGQNKIIIDYVNSTDTATVDSDWAQNPNSGSVYQIVPFVCTVSSSEVGDIVWEDLLSGRTTAGTSGKKLADLSTSGGGSDLFLLDGSVGGTGNDTTHVHLDVDGIYANDYFNNKPIIVYDVSDSDRAYFAYIEDFVGSSSLATLDRTLPITPATTDNFAIIALELSSAENTSDVFWDALTADHTVSGSFGKKIGDIPKTITLPKNTATSGNRISFFSVGTNGQFTTGASSVSCTISLDGGTEAAVTDSPTENEFGSDASTWSFDLTQAETNANQANIVCVGTSMRTAAIHLEFQE